MKKLLFVAAIAVLGLASCTKEYTCECTTSDSSGLIDDVTTSSTFEATKSDAEAACGDLEITVLTMTSTCELK